MVKREKKNASRAEEEPGENRDQKGERGSATRPKGRER